MKNLICKSLTIIFLTFLCHTAVGQESLHDIFIQLKGDSLADAQKLTLTKKAEKILVDSLKKTKSFAPSFNHPEMGRVLSDDNKVCIYSWAFQLSDKSYYYSSIIKRTNWNWNYFNDGINRTSCESS